MLPARLPSFERSGIEIGSSLLSYLSPFFFFLLLLLNLFFLR
jgi:hypothetical protein